jgi:hypothetical protein
MADPKEEAKKREEEARKRAEDERKKHEERDKKNRDDMQAREKHVSDQQSKRGSRPGGSLAYSPAPKGEPLPTVDPRGDTFLTHDEISDLAGELRPGEIGWLKLDEEGTPVGAATNEIPKTATESFARVVGAPSGKYDEIVTPSGAPVTRFMNPEAGMWDEGMLLRNPPPEETEEQKKWKSPAGAPVVNQPVTT